MRSSQYGKQGNNYPCRKDSMKTYTVRLHLSFQYDIKADTENEAETKARQLAAEELPELTVVNFDTDTIEEK